MLIAEQTADRLRLVDRRKENPVAGRMRIAGWIFTVLVAIGTLFSATTQHLISAIVFLAVIWSIVALSTRATRWVTPAGTAVFDGLARRVEVANSKPVAIDFADIFSVEPDDDRSVLLNLQDGTQLALSAESGCTAEEHQRAVAAVLQFLRAHHWRPPQPQEDEDDEGDSPFDRERAAADRWIHGLDANAARQKPCAFCASGRGDGAPIEVMARHERLALSASAFIPRCSRCARVQKLHANVPVALAALSFFATFIFCAVMLSQSMHNGLAFAAAFVGLILGVPIAVGVALSFLTNPRFFGTRPVETWEENRDIVTGTRNGWKFAALAPPSRRR